MPTFQARNIVLQVADASNGISVLGGAIAFVG
jgi:hypothetical protein